MELHKEPISVASPSCWCYDPHFCHILCCMCTQLL